MRESAVNKTEIIRLIKSSVTAQTEWRLKRTPSVNEDKLEAVRLIDASIPRGSRWNYSNSFIGDDIIIEVSRCSDGIVYINHISFETLKMPVLRFLDRADRCT